MAEPVIDILDANDGGQCHLTVLNGDRQDATPVVLCHGMFTDRRFWLSERGVGLAAYLAEAGHPVFILQRRGLSDSPPCPARYGLDEHIDYDIPALDARLAEHYAKPAIWIGHSFGGVGLARGLARHVAPERIAGLVLLASQFEVGKHMLDWPGNLATRALVALRGHLPARTVGLGPVDEPAPAVQDACTWVSEGRRQPGLKQELSRLTAPTLAISGTADRVDPTAGCRAFVSHFASTDIQFIEAGTAHGFTKDYDHPGIVVSKAAREEIWSMIRDWLAARR